MDAKFENGLLVLDGVVMQPKSFATGSKGWFDGGKVTVDGKRYQVNCQAIVIGSKNMPDCAPVDAVAMSPQYLPAKSFSTGSRGFFATGKQQIGGWNCQVQVQAIEIGSKPESIAAAETRIAKQEANVMAQLAKVDEKRKALEALKSSVA